MAYHSAKVYFDGSHYIAIPQKTQPTTTRGSGFKDAEFDEKKKAFGVRAYHTPCSCKESFAAQNAVSRDGE